MSFFGELRRRNVAKVAVAYAIVGWLSIEVSSTVFPLLQLPSWTATFVAVLLIMGFPIALILSWAYELTPEGMKRSHEVEPTESITQATGQKLNYAVIGALVLALGFVVYNYVLVDVSQEAVVQETTPAAEPAFENSVPVVIEEQQEVLPNSVAVLPFDNLSPDPDNAYFAAGIHEEILNALVKLRNLSVISRTSVVRYADSTLSIPEIAEELNVETIMEGSVRYAGDRVRITAQLIDARTDEHLWSDAYERDFSDVFGIQADIAMNIANAMQVEFSVAEQQSIEVVPTESPAAYSQYLRAIDSWISGDASWRSEIDQAVALDPNFAVALAEKAYLMSLGLAVAGANTTPSQAAVMEAEAREAAEQALILDPTLGTAHAALAALHELAWEGEAAEQAFRLAYALTPDSDVHMAYGRFKRYRGDFDDAIRLGERGVELDPQNGLALNQLGVTYRFARRFDEAIPLLRDSMELPPGPNVGALLNIALSEAGRGNLEESARQLDLAKDFPLSNFSVFRISQLALVSSLAGRMEEAARFFSEFQAEAEVNPVSDAVWARAYIAVGNYDAALQSLESAVSDRVSTDLATLAELAVNTWGDPMLDEPEFRELLDDLWIDE